MKNRSIAMLLCLMMVFCFGATSAFAGGVSTRSLDDGYYDDHDLVLIEKYTSSEAQNAVYAMDDSIDLVEKIGKYGAGVLSAAEFAKYKELEAIVGGQFVLLATLTVEVGWSLTRYNILNASRKYDYVKIYRPKNSNAIIVVGSDS